LRMKQQLWTLIVREHGWITKKWERADSCGILR
jgi:hypothetical protein